MRCKILTQDGYAKWLFIFKRIRIVVIQYVKESLISHYSASLVFQSNLATLAGKTKHENADHISIGQFYEHGLFFLWRFHNAHTTL